MIITYESEWAGIISGKSKVSRLVRCPKCGGVRMDFDSPHAPFNDGTDCGARMTAAVTTPSVMKPEPVKVQVHIFTKKELRP